MNEKLLICHPFSDCNHTADNIKRMTLQGLVDMGVSAKVDTVSDHVHGCTPDEASNMLRAWDIFEGAGCVCHRANNCLKTALKDDHVGHVLKGVKAVCAHFHRSVKVSMPVK